MTVALFGPIVLELAADAAVRAAVGRLRQSLTVRRVAESSFQSARTREIHISTGSLMVWLRRGDVQQALAAGQVSASSAAFANLRWLLSDVAENQRDTKTSELLGIVLYQLLRESDPAHAAALSHQWLGAAVADEGRLTREVVKAEGQQTREALVHQLTDSKAFPDHLRTFHPWRAERALRVADIWPPTKGVIASIALSDDRTILLTSWSRRTPTTLSDAPPEVWCLLGELATDYQARLAAVTFFRRAIDRGAAPAAYWFARAALAIGADDESAATELLDESGGDHPLSAAVRADIEGEPERAAAAVARWEPTADSDRALKALFTASWRSSRGDHNAALDVIVQAANTFPQSAAMSLRAAEMLIWRIQEGRTLRGTDDAQSALAWAIKARNSMRTWGGPSWQAVKIAVAASGLLHDLDRSFRLTQPPPDGEAIATEVRHPDIAKQAAVLAAMLRRFDHAAELAQAIDDEYTRATVAALTASEGDHSVAKQEWHRAYAAAESNVERLQTATTMAAYGIELPDLADLGGAFPDRVAELRTVAALPIDPSARLVELRARAGESPRMTLELAAAHNDREEYDKAARVLEDGGAHWSEPHLMKMAADRYARAGNSAASQRCAEAALGLAAPQWGGETDARMLLFDALEAQGDFAGTTREAGKLLQLDPENADARWAFIYCLVRQGDLAAAWNALTPTGDPVMPRDHRDASVWVSLLTRFDHSDQYLRRILDGIARWRDREDVLGKLITQAYLGLSLHGREPADADLNALHSATEEFIERFPSSKFFRSVTFDPDDPLGFVAEHLRRRHEGLQELAEMWRLGRLPSGMMAHAVGRTRTELALVRGPTPRHSHRANRDARSADVLAEALGAEVVLDLTAAAALASFAPELASSLVARFSRTMTTDLDLHDALSAQTTLGLRSPHSLIWDPSIQAPRPITIEDDETERLVIHSARIFDFLSASRVSRRPEERLLTLAQLRDEEDATGDDSAGERNNGNEVEPAAAEDPSDSTTTDESDGRADGDGSVRGTEADNDDDLEWMSSLELAAAMGSAIWCDDVALQNLAEEFGVPAFGTVDLLRHLAAKGQLVTELAKAAEAILIDAYHVDLGFDPEVMNLAGELAGWRPAGAAHALSRPLAWLAADATMSYLMNALERSAVEVPDVAHGWVANAALGLARGLTADQASSNLRLLLARILGSRWPRSEHFPFILSGIRVGVAEVEDCPDPIKPVLHDLHASLVERHGHRPASLLIMSLAKSASEADRQLVTEIVLRAE